MKIRSGFMLREIADQWVVVPLGDRVVEFNGIMALSESGAMLWKKMENHDAEEEDLLKYILSEYEIDANTAKSDIREFIELIDSKGLLSR